MKTLETAGILTRHKFHGDWNYTINANPATRPTALVISSVPNANGVHDVDRGPFERRRRHVG